MTQEIEATTAKYESDNHTVFTPGQYLVWEDDEERGYIVDEVRLTQLYYSGNWHRINYREIDE
jgi:hypothetical protein